MKISCSLLCVILLLLCGQALADSCSSLTDETSCTANTACTYTAGTGDACKNQCNSLTDYSQCQDLPQCTGNQQGCAPKNCSGSTLSDCTTNKPYCTFTDGQDADCTPIQTLIDYCSAMDQQTCSGDPKCSFVAGYCDVQLTYCTVVNGGSCTNSSECTYSGQVNSTCNNTGGEYCQNYNSNQDTCNQQASCSYQQYSCSNNPKYACTGKEDQATCTGKSKFCTYALPPGTCALKNPTPSNPNPPTPSNPNTSTPAETTTSTSTTNSILLIICSSTLAITLLI